VARALRTAVPQTRVSNEETGTRIRQEGEEKREKTLDSELMMMMLLDERGKLKYMVVPY